MDARLACALPILLAVPLLLLGAGSAAPSAVPGLLTALGLVLGLGAAGWRISRRRLPDLSAPSRATASLVFAAALAVVPATVLGHCGLLEPRLFLTVEALLILSTLALRAPGGSPLESAPDRPGRIPGWLARGEAAALMAAGAAAMIFLVQAAHAERHAPPDKLDDPAYHLPAVAVWSQSQDLRMIKFDAGDVSTAFYPIGGELVDWALLVPLRDSDFLLRWSQVPFALGSLAALAAIALHLGLSRRSALLSALLFLTVRRAFPVLMLSAGNDLGTAFYTLAAVDAALVFGRSRAAGSALYAGLALGLLAGTKYVGLMYALPLSALLAAAAARRRGPTAAGALQAVLLIGSALAAGGYTYLRNAWSLGNPFFPDPVLGLPGWAAVTLAVRRHLPVFQIDLRDFLLVRTDAFGELCRFTMLPAALLAPAMSPWRRGDVPERIVRTLVLALPLIFFLQFLYMMHDHSDIRYFFAAVALAAVAFGWLLEGVAERWPSARPLVRGGLALLVAHELLHASKASAWSELAALAVLLALGVVAAAGWVEPRRWLAGHRLAWAALACGLAVAGAASLGGTLQSYQERKYEANPLAAFFDRDIGPQGMAIAYSGGNRPYPLFGSRLQNRVEIVPAQGPLEDRFYGWGGSAIFPFAKGTYRQWSQSLRGLGIQYVVLDDPLPRLRRRIWIQRHPLDFEHVLDFGPVEVWRLRAGESPGG